jgi:hypothetical protein
VVRDQVAAGAEFFAACVHAKCQYSNIVRIRKSRVGLFHYGENFGMGEADGAKLTLRPSAK